MKPKEFKFELIEGGRKDELGFELDYFFRPVLCPDCKGAIRTTFHPKWQISTSSEPGHSTILRLEDDIHFECDNCGPVESSESGLDVEKMKGLFRIFLSLPDSLPGDVVLRITDNGDIAGARKD